VYVFLLWIRLIFWHFTPTFVYLFVRWRHQLLASLRTPAAVGLASNLKLFLLVTLLPWPFTFRPLNGITVHPGSSLPSVFSSFRSRLRGQVRDRQTDGHTNDGHQRLTQPPHEGGGTIKCIMFNAQALSEVICHIIACLSVRHAGIVYKRLNLS